MKPSFSDSQESYGNFTVKDVQKIEDLSLYYVELLHTKTGARVVHLQNEDIENVFSISLQTLPDSSNGSAHILEHTVLCGSKKYPVKDPFFSMIRRSLHTFMNAFTGMDFTCYPASSENVTDFYHLFDVYLDAVFFPKLTKESFLQEGHRLEFLKKEDPSSALLYKGVVFNEMKGAMSSMESRFWQHIFEGLFPTLPYHHNSGGSPAVIPTLTHEELLQFHQNFYNPSNAIFYFYGNIDTKKHLDFLEEKVLKDAKKRSLHPPLLKEKRLTSPVTIEKPYPARKGETSVIGVAFLTASISDVEEVLALSLLDSILMDTDASPLKKALLDFGIKTVDSYFETEISEAPFILLCKGCGEKTAEEVRDFVLQTMEEIAKKRIATEKILEALHSLEFSRKEISNDHYPYGLSLFMRAILAKQHGADATASLKVDELFTKLKNQAKNPEFFSLLIEKYFLKNSHCVSLFLKPEEGLTLQEEKKEKKTLESIQKSLSEKQKKQIVEQAVSLANYQEALEKTSLDCLPKICLKDVRKEAKKMPLTCKETFHRDVFTNKIIYLDACISLPKIAPQDMRYLPLFADFFSEVGTKNRTFSENLSFINANLGGFEAYFSINVQAKDADSISPILIIRAKALDRNRQALCTFLREMLEEVDFSDENRILQLLEKEKVELKSQMVSHAMHYAKSLARSGVKMSSYLYDLLYGFRYFQTVQELAKQPKTSAEHLKNLFTSWKNTFFQQKIDWIVTTDQQEYDLLRKEKFFGLLDRPVQKTAPFDPLDVPFSSQRSEGILIPSPVAFTALSLPAPNYLDPHCPALLAAAELMQNTWLHKEIREKGGAYGSGAHFDPLRGDITFRAYRDPHLHSSVDAFEKALSSIGKAEFTSKDLEEATLGVIQDLDQPISPGSEGLTSYLREKKGITSAAYQTLRDRLLALKPSTVQQAVASIGPFDHSVLISFSNSDFFARENEKFPSPLPIKKT